jgi:hypothetical protein
MKFLYKLAFVICLFVCGITTCAVSSDQQSVNQQVEQVTVKKMGKKRSNKKISQAQKVKKNLVKKQKGSKGFLRHVLALGGAVSGAAIGSIVGLPLDFVHLFAFYSTLVFFSNVYLGALCMTVSLTCAVAYYSCIGYGAYRGAQFGWNYLGDDLSNESSYDHAYVSVPELG